MRVSWCSMAALGDALLTTYPLDERFFKETGTPLYSSHMIDLSEEDVKYNIETTAK